MKLNNRGWGLTDYLLIVSVIIIALFGASVLIIRLSNGLKENMKVNTPKTEETINTNTNIQEPEEDDNEDINYQLVEQKMNDAANKYIETYYNNTVGDSGIIVDKQHLLELDNSLEKEMSKDNCNGYVEVKKANEKISYTSYLKCDNHSTNGVKDYYLD